jgi:hypothetical protein
VARPIGAQLGRPAALHAAALGALALGALFTGWEWLVGDRMPPADFPGYAAQVEQVRDALLAHGRVPRWCLECFAGASRFTSHLKELLVFPLALVFEPVLATKLAYLGLRVAGGFGLYWLAARELRAPGAGLVAGYAYAFGAIANHHAVLLDLALASALLPPLLLATAAVVRRRSAASVVALGALSAAMLVNNWVYAFAVPAAVAMLALGRPWQAGAAAAATDTAWWRRAALPRIAAAFGVTLVLTVSHLGWLAADTRHHALLSEERIALERGLFVERSPFLLVNRANALEEWLRGHQTPGLDVTVVDRGGSYLGLVALAALGIGWPWLRRHPGLAGWARVGFALSLLSYWLSLGPHTLLWQIAASFQLSDAVQSGLRSALLGAAALCAAFGALAFAARRWRPGSALARAPVAGPAWASLWLLFPCVSLWSLCASVLPPFSLQRSPGHFFEALPFWFCLAFAAALAAIARALPRPAAARALLAAVGVAVVVDYAPSREFFAKGTPLPPLEALAVELRALDGEGGTQRIGIPGLHYPLMSWLAAQAPTGRAWSWLHWQSGRHWKEFYEAAAPLDVGPDGTASQSPDVNAALMRMARVRYFLVVGPTRLAPPWRRTREVSNLKLWSLPEVAPPASGHRAYTREDGGAVGAADVSARLERALRQNALVLHAPAEGWRHAPQPPPGPPPFAVRYRRPHPERISLELDAGDAPAWVFVSESHHPWWRAEVDGARGEVVRAQQTFLAVPVPAGARRVELRFEPPGWLRVVDATTRLAALGVALALAVAGWRRWRRASPRGYST